MERQKIIYNPHARPYYQDTYPYELVRKFLALNSATEANGYYPENLECSFIALDSEDKIKWKRYLAFPTKEEFKGYLTRGEPLRVEIGGYGFSPACFWRGQTAVKQRTDDHEKAISASHLVIDVDLKDYDDVRGCSCKYNPKQRCSDCHSEEITVDSSCNCEWKNLGSVCRTCWAFATAGMIVTDYILRNFWGFVDFFFFFSGKKGFHCWILDPGTEEFTKQERKQFVASFEPWKSPARIKLCDESSTRSSVAARNFDSYLEAVFEGVIIQEGSLFFLPNIETWHSIVQAFDMNAMDESMFDRFEMHFNPKDLVDSLTLWETCKAFLDSNYPSDEAMTIKRRIMYRYTFPRIDRSVTTKPEHAKKSIFSIHPETNRVATPILPHIADTLFNFRPNQTPLATQVDDVNFMIETLRRELAISDSLLKEISYCRYRLGEFVNPNVDYTEMNFDEGVADVFIRTHVWLLDNNANQSIILPWEESHFEHYAKCKHCVDYIFLDNRSTVQYWIVSNSWVNGVYSKTLEAGFKLAWLVYLCKNCPEVEINPETTRALEFYYQKLKLGTEA